MATTSSERAYHRIRSQILAGRYAGGERLKEEAVARDLAISRTPVRDAIRRLQAEGLVSVTPNSGARVASWSADELAEITEMRARLEGFAAALAAVKIGQAGLDHLERLNEEMARAVERMDSPDIDAISACNLAFHRQITLAAGNGRLTSMVESLMSAPVVLRKFALFDRQRLLVSLAHHREILSALHARDAEWVEALMRSHILAARGYDRLISNRREPS